MGLLKVGEPMKWKDSKEHLQYVRHHGVLQFVETYNRVKDTANDELLWGDEVEYGILEASGEGQDRTIRVSLCGTPTMKQLRQREAETDNSTHNGCTWHQEYGSWMLEGTPQKPYAGYVRDLLEVENNMRLRRARILAILGPNQIAPTVTNFPLFGVGHFTSPPTEPGGEYAQSEFVSDACINPHPRFGTLTRNIRSRRGSKVDIRMPLFRDTETPEFKDLTLQQLPPTPGHTLAGVRETTAASSEAASSSSASSSAAPAPAPTSPAVEMPPPLDLAPTRGYMASWPEQWPTVHMDCMAFGMGCCCLQVTFQNRDVLESRWMYDQLAGLSPIMLALTAATPIFKGRLLDSDARWAVISQSVDDRTDAERGVASTAGEAEADPLMVAGGINRLQKSRYDSISCYLSEDTPDSMSDVVCEVDDELQQLLLFNGMDKALARHVAHLFVRDPLVIFQGNVSEVDDHQATDHWENLQSTNWQTMRWKPPPPSSPCAPQIGWRTEFRSMEVQLSDLENAAFTVFIVLVTRVLLVFDLDLRIPLSFVDANMHRAHHRDAVTKQKFYFRNCFDPIAGSACVSEVEEMTMEEIVLGKGDYFPGLVPLIYAYLEHINCDPESFKSIDMYLNLITSRANGKTKTDAAWIREFVTSHADYKHDSVVTPTIAHDLMHACNDIGRGVLKPSELFGAAATKIAEVTAEDAYGSPLASEKLTSNCRSELIRRITSRGVSRSRANSDFVRAEERKSQYQSDVNEAAEIGLRDF